jgi:hypothetical protein
MLPQCDNAAAQSISREADWAWLAGIYDGEGCLSVELKMAGNGKMYVLVKVRVINTDVRMIQKCARIYKRENVVFYYNINKRRKPHYKDQMAILVTSQGSCLKVLQGTLPHLANKQPMAEALIALIEFVKSFPKGGNTSSYDYINTETFAALMDRVSREKKFLIEPSTTTRRAGEVCSWEGSPMIWSGLAGDSKRQAETTCPTTH